MWKPLIKRDNDSWIGATAQPGIWVGTKGCENKAVDLREPIFLWPLMERQFESVFRELCANWEEFRIPDFTPDQLIDSILVNSIGSGRPYWVGLAINWLESMVADSCELQPSTIDALIDVDREGMEQELRHRARRLAQRITR